MINKDMKDQSPLSNNCSKRRAVFWNSILFFWLIIIALASASFALVIKQSFTLDELKTKVNKNNGWKNSYKLRKYYFGKKPETYIHPDIKASFQKDGKDETFDNKKENYIAPEDDFLSADYIYRQIINRVGLEGSIQELINIIKTEHAFDFLLTTDQNQLNDKNNLNSVFFKVKNGFVKAYLSNSNSENIEDSNELSAFVIEGDAQEKERQSKMFKFRNYFDFAHSGFKIFLLKSDSVLGDNPLETFDLALLINPDTLEIKLIARIWAQTTKPKIKIQKKAGSIWKNKESGLSWKISHLSTQT